MIDARIKIIEQATDTQLLDWCQRYGISSCADIRYPGMWVARLREESAQYSFGGDTIRETIRGLLLYLLKKEKFEP